MKIYIAGSNVSIEREKAWGIYYFRRLISYHLITQKAFKDREAFQMIKEAKAE